ncbi:Ig-like domain-containing protein [Actinoplanes oblitus]|uniref:Ig-like domain-containing protein n=1 Tax=Actinoplanes oblitus TaxID=3040509 RepID=A0ABY8WF66_9ACTN|nr:Ig-like domain-containing protein [Actinoplanes oblitus]WIM95009.1 Ig-like domain-containing protein [Actinoplanes oblitus]
MGLRRAATAMLVAVLLAVTMLTAGRAGAAISSPFRARFDANTNGSIILRGNANLTCLQTGQPTCAQARNGTAVGTSANNNSYAMAYTDVDTNPLTFNDSMATLDMPPGSTVLFAGLYWGADSSSPLRDQVLFSTDGGGSYKSVTAATLVSNGSIAPPLATIYQGFADVTAQVAGGGNGVYAVANIQASIASGSYAGWSLVVAYHNAAEDMRALRVYDGFGQVSGGNTNIPITGFETPHTGTVHAKIGAVAYEGDRGTPGDSLQVDGRPLSDGQNSATNFFNSTVSDSGTPVGGRNPGYDNTLGFDVDQVDATGMFGNAATSTTLTLTTTGDQYYPGVITFTIDLYAPNITTTPTVTDLNGGDLLPGDVLEYRIAVRNEGNDIADGVVLSDAVPNYTSYVPGSLTVEGAPVTDATGDDAGSFGAGAAGWTLGTIPVAGTTFVTFRVTVQPGAPPGYPITNLVNVTYSGRTSGVSVAATGATSASTVQQPHDDLAAALGVTPAVVQRAATPAVVTYTATVTNTTGDLEPAATATLTLPAGVAPGAMPTGCWASGQVVTCALGPLVAGSSAHATVPATVTGSATANPVATVRAGGTGADANSANDTATAALVVNRPPSAVADAATTAFGTSVTITVSANDSDPDDPMSTLVYSVSSPPPHGVAVAHSDRSITYTPAAGWSGTDTFRYTADDPNGGSGTATVTVTTANAAPVAADDMVNTPTNTPVTVDVLQNDLDPNGDPLTVDGVTQPPPTDGTVTFTATDVTFTPDPVFAGPTTFTYTVSDPSGDTATAVVSVDVENAKPTAADDLFPVSYPAAQAGAVLPAAANDTDPNNDPLTVTAAGQPAPGAGTTSLSGGLIAYTAPPRFSGTATFSYTVSDGRGGTNTAQVTVVVADAPPVAQAFVTTTGYRTALTLNVLAAATDPNNDSLHVSGATAPAHGAVTRDPLGKITYLPDVAFSGTDSFAYTIDDGNGGTDTATVTVTVANGLPHARDDAVTAPGGPPMAIDVLANDDPDPNGDPLTVAIDGPPGHGGVTVGPGGRVTYTPAAHFSGVDTFHYTLDDGSHTLVGATVTATVLNVAPDARPDATATDTNTLVIVPVLANDDDPNGDPMTLAAVDPAAHGTVTANADGTVTYLPATGFTGTDAFVYSITDPLGLADSATVTITVRNAPPIAADDAFTALPATPANLSVLANDSDPNTGQVITVASATTPAQGTLTLAGGLLTYRANPGAAGMDGFDYVITDDRGATATAHVSIHINGVPAAADDAVSVPADTAVDIAVTANDTDPESQPLRVTAADTPSHGATRLNPDQTVEYRPDPGFFGTDTFGYTIADSAGNTASAKVTVRVANAAPVARPDTAALLSDRSVLIDVLADDSDPNPGQTVTVVSAGQPANGTAVLATGGIKYTPAPGYVGPDAFPYTISDGNGGTATGTVTVTVSDGVPVAVPDARRTPYGRPIAVDVLTNDLDPAGTLAVTAVGVPDRGTATFTASMVNYMPPAGFSGTATLDYTAVDDAGHRTSAAIAVLVGVPPSVPNKQTTVLDGQSVRFGLPVTGQDGRPVTLTGVSRPQHGSVVVNADGTVTYVPDPGFSGTDEFTYQVVDADGNVAVAMVHVIVPPPPSPSLSPSVSGSGPAPSPSTSGPGPSPSPPVFASSSPPVFASSSPPPRRPGPSRTTPRPTTPRPTAPSGDTRPPASPVTGPEAVTVALAGLYVVASGAALCWLAGRRSGKSFAKASRKNPPGV